MSSNKGFTLIELLVVIAIIAILAGAAIYAINPGRLFSQARDSQRWSAVNAIISAVNQNMVTNKGNFSCAAGALPTATTTLGTGGYDIANCLVPTYMTALPLDPATGTDADTGYSLIYNTSTRRITVSANAPEIEASISVSR